MNIKKKDRKNFEITSKKFRNIKNFIYINFTKTKHFFIFEVGNIDSQLIKPKVQYSGQNLLIS